jgi:hypothetical protein
MTVMNGSEQSAQDKQGSEQKSPVSEIPSKGSHPAFRAARQEQGEVSANS